MTQPTLQVERRLWKKGCKKVACLDEAGRGPLAGPVVAAAVVIIKNLKLKTEFRDSGAKRKKKTKSSSHIKNLQLRDSKKLSQKQREKFYKILTKNKNIKWGIAKVSEKVIDRINIKNAAELAMEKAVEKLKTKNEKRRIKPDFLIIDGKYLKNHKLKTINHKLIVKADEKVFSCACASILAKVTRDRIMVGYHKKYPKYRFDLHKGYPTKLHLKLLKKYGPCKIHRKSFMPVRTCKAKRFVVI